MKISVIGAGYVGLVTASCLAELGHSIDLIEIDQEKAEMILAGISPINEPGLDDLLSKHISHNLRVITNYNKVHKSRLSFVCVGTPQMIDGNTDLSMIKAVSKSLGTALGNAMTQDHIIVVKSTVPPGTTEGLISSIILGYTGDTENKIKFAMNPEFLREGRAITDFMNPDRIIIGCIEQDVGDTIASVYFGLNAPIMRTAPVVAEMIKYASNALLATKISFSNEIGNICKRLNIDVYDVMRGVGMDHRISPHFLNAGVGFGGSCFPKDVMSLMKVAESLGENPVLLKSVIKVNEQQPLRMVEMLEKRAGPLAGKVVAVLGLAFKNDTDDVRDSSALPVIKELLRRGALVRAYDPLAIPNMSKIIPDIEYCESTAEALKDADACLIMTEWPEFGELGREFDAMRSKVILEGRRILSSRANGVDGICW